MVFLFSKQSALLAAAARGTGMFLLFIEQKQPRRGREHLVDWERSEPIYLVIRDHLREPQRCSIFLPENGTARWGQEYLLEYERSEIL
jgi:hypothetical protein